MQTDRTRVEKMQKSHALLLTGEVLWVDQVDNDPEVRLWVDLKFVLRFQRGWLVTRKARRHSLKSDDPE